MNTETRERTLLSLRGLSVGDALGERFFGWPEQVLENISERRLPEGTWYYTDDTEMALSIVQVLFERGRIDPDLLARTFAMRYDSRRGYGAGAHLLLQQLRAGGHWKEYAPAMFGGAGSFGNGAAMRVAPLGAFFAGDREAVVENAVLSARVTHAHPEGVAGAIAVALAAAFACEARGTPALDADQLFQAVLERTPVSETRDGIESAASMGKEVRARDVASRLGSGQAVSSQDTVPFVIWAAARHLDSFEDAFWTTVAGLGDRDTTCAMVGGIVALSSGSVPEKWWKRREPLPEGFER